MTTLGQAVAEVQRAQRRSNKPLAVILAGHNGSGKSTMWRRHLSPSDVDKLLERFPRTQKAIAAASPVADATIFTDNSRTARQAFTVCRIQIGEREAFDMRGRAGRQIPSEIREWLGVVSPRSSA